MNSLEICRLIFFSGLNFSHKLKVNTMNWSKDCEGRKFLIKQFKKFISSGGLEGIDFRSAQSLKPKQVKEQIFDKYPEQLQEYKRDRFPDNFRDTIRAFEIDLKKSEARKKGNLFVLFLN